LVKFEIANAMTSASTVAHDAGLRVPRAILDAGNLWLWGLLLLTAAIVVPPVLFLVETSLTPDGADAGLTLDHYAAVFELSGWRIWRVSLTYAAGSSCFAIAVGVTAAWLVARTNAYCRQVTVLAAYLSLAAPVMVKAIGWILLLGPNKGVINEALRAAFGIEGVPIELFSLTGMTLLEGILWVPVVFLLTLPALGAMDPSLEEAAIMSGASLRQTLVRVTLRLALPSVLGVFMLTFIRAVESFEVPLLIGAPANLQTFTTAIYQTMHKGFVPQYGEASAYAVLLVFVVALPLALYYRATRHAQKYATITGKGYRPALTDLGAWRLPAGIFLLLIPLALLAPLLILFWASFLPIYEPPSIADLGRLSFASYSAVLTRPTTIAGLWNGLIVATLSSAAVTAFTFVLAWTVVRSRGRMRWLLDVLATLPLVLPGIVLGTAVLVEFLQAPIIPIYGTIWIMVFAFLIRFMPYGMRFCYAGILSLHVHLEECARTCGAGTAMVLWRIVMPLTLPAVASIWIYVFLHSIRDLSVPIMLAGPENRLIAVVILDLWNEGKVPEVGALSILLAAVATALGFFFMRLSRRYGSKAL
jgi:iron(III) transport system permease protein